MNSKKLCKGNNINGKHISIEKQFINLRDAISSLNLKTKKKEYILDMIDSLQISIIENIKISNVEYSEDCNVLRTHSDSRVEFGAKSDIVETSKKKRRRLFNKNRHESEKTTNVQNYLNTSHRKKIIPIQPSDSMKSLHLFLENRAARLKLDEEDNNINLSAFEKLQGKLLNISVTQFKKSIIPYAILFGPDDSENADRYANIASACTISTYPLIAPQYRSGDPICDRFYCQLYKEMSIITLADGCNWGDKPREAAILACNEIVSYLSLRLTSFKDTSDIGCLLLKALRRAHDKILATKDILYDAGTTTVLAGILVKLEQGVEGKQWVFVCVSVGDCKAFYYSKEEKTFVDITIGNRMNLTDARDCGGRLGPADADGINPDLRNLRLYQALLNEDDIVVVLSDGVHDNLDPQLRGKKPSDFDINCEDWIEAENLYQEETYNVKSKYLIDTMNETVHSKQSTITPHLLTSSLIELAKETTRPSREYMEKTGKAQPDDYSKYPGKMDHTSCISIKVCDIPQHPFNDLQSLCKVPCAYDKFKKYIQKNQLIYQEALFKDNSSDKDIKHIINMDIEYLKDIYNIPNELSNIEYIKYIFELYLKYHQHNNTILLSDNIQIKLQTYCKEYITNSKQEVENRVNTLFQVFQQAKWMKFKCFNNIE